MSGAASPWMTAAEGAAYIKRGKRFLMRQIHAGRVRAARIGGRGEILTRPDWLDQYVQEQAQPVVVAVRRRA